MYFGSGYVTDTNLYIRTRKDQELEPREQKWRQNKTSGKDIFLKIPSRILKNELRYPLEFSLAEGSIHVFAYILPSALFKRIVFFQVGYELTVTVPIQNLHTFTNIKFW